MKKHTFKSGTFLLAAVILATVSFAETNKPAAAAEVVVAMEEGVPGGVIVNALAIQAKVVAVNYETRELTLLMPGEVLRTIEVGPEAINFNQIKKGDMVKALVTEELVVKMGSADSELDDGGEAVAVLAAEGANPGGIVASTVRMTATVTAIDIEARTATLTFEDGTTKIVAVRPDIDLSKHKAGEKVVFEITEMVAISVEKQ